MIKIRIDKQLYQDLKQNKITKHNYAYAIYSISKHAKIVRDKLDAQPNNKALAQNYAQLYDIKVKLLDKLEPKQIHRINYTKPIKASHYFLLYKLSRFSFHKPIKKSAVKYYPTLTTKTIATNLRIRKADVYYLFPVALCLIIANRTNTLSFI